MASSLPSERSFGFLFVVVFAGLAGYGFYKHWNDQYLALAIGTSILLLFLTFFAPKVLAPFNKAWHHLGLLLGKIISPIVLGVIFFGLLLPIALITRLFGRDELRLKRRTITSYWRDRLPPGPASDSFKNQF